ncbi:hypothetical protein [Dokdonia sp. PRO95]|uniref:hypothetical protein n=1 Tax=Dokdonia sp. PRO95 TaxID=1239415 RepID=UPI00054F476A|nr:hypothetical protein [Dokdonia sp. PRO95]
MINETSLLLDFVTNELSKAGFTITADIDRVEGLDFLITAPTGRTSELQLRSINLHEEESIKIQKLDYGQVAPHRFLGLVTIINNTPRAFYIIPSATFTTADNEVFFNHPMEMMPHLSHWEIKVYTAAVPKLAQYEISNFYKV